MIRKQPQKRDHPSSTPLSSKKTKRPRRDLKHAADPVSNEERISSNVCASNIDTAIGAANIAKEQLSILPNAIQIRTEQWVDTLQPVLLNIGASNGGEAGESSIRSISRMSCRDSVCHEIGSGGLVSGLPTTCVSIAGGPEHSQHDIKREIRSDAEDKSSPVRLLLCLLGV